MLCPSVCLADLARKHGQMLPQKDTHSAAICCAVNSTFKKNVSRKEGENYLLSFISHQIYDLQHLCYGKVIQEARKEVFVFILKARELWSGWKMNGERFSNLIRNWLKQVKTTYWIQFTFCSATERNLFWIVLQAYCKRLFLV